MDQIFGQKISDVALNVENINLFCKIFTIVKVGNTLRVQRMDLRNPGDLNF